MCHSVTSCQTASHPGVEVAIFVWELTQDTIHLPLSCLQDGKENAKARQQLTHSLRVPLPHNGLQNQIILPPHEVNKKLFKFALVPPRDSERSWS